MMYFCLVLSILSLNSVLSDNLLQDAFISADSTKAASIVELAKSKLAPLKSIADINRDVLSIDEEMHGSLDLSDNIDLEATSSVQGLVTISDSALGNQLQISRRSGSSAPYTYRLTSYDTGGVGSGSFVFSQNFVAVKDNLVFALNYGSNSVSSFSIAKNGTATRRSVVSTNGLSPVSLAVYGNLLVVLNGGNLTETSDNVPVNPSLQSYRISSNGRLTALTNGYLLINIPSDYRVFGLIFSTNGTQLVMSAIAIGLVSFSISSNGVVTPVNFVSDVGATGIAITSNNIVISAGAIFNTTSSYSLSSSGEFTLMTSVSTINQPTYVQLSTSNERFEYTSLIIDNLLTSGKINRPGNVHVNQLTAIHTNQFSYDMTMNSDGSLLYVVAVLGDIQVFSVDNDNGALTFVQTINGLPFLSRGIGYFSV